MKEDIFDNIIKDKLEGYTSNSKNADPWSAFELFEAKNKQITEDKNQSEFDGIIKSSLMKVAPVYRNDHWQILKNELKTIEERKNTVFISKIMEFAAIFLIVFTYFQWSGYTNQKDHRQQEILQYANEVLPQSEGHDTKAAETSFSNNANKEKDKSYFGVKDIKDAQEIILETTMVTKVAESLLSDASVSNQEELDSGRTFDVPNNPDDAENANFADVDPKIIIYGMQSLEAKEINAVLTKNQEILSINALYNPITENLSSDFALVIPMQLAKPKLKPEYALSLFTSADINLINTPFDKLYSKASYNKEALNNSFGLNISKKMDKFELESGLGYSKREYQPLLIKEAFGPQENSYSEISLNKISYHLATVPLDFKYHFINQSNWGAYIMAGVALNLVMNADYEKQEVEVLGKPAPGRYLPEEARLEEKPFIKGFLAGDSFNETYFASVGFGFGIQKKLFNNTTIYVQPSYQRHVLSGDIGIGPNKDKIHTSSLQFGVKTILN